MTRHRNEPRARRTNRHKTFIVLADTINDLALNTSGVTGVSAGLISPAGPGSLRVKFIEESGSLLVKVRGPIAVQDVRIYGRDHVAIKNAIIEQLRQDKRLIKIEEKK